MYKKRIADISRLFVYIFSLVQGILGIIWMGCNLMVYIPETLSENYLLAASTLVVDDYMGVLYALFLAPFVAMIKNMAVLHAMVSVIQVFFVVAAVYYAAHELWSDELKKSDCLVLSALVAGIPGVLQTCFSLIPNAMLFSLLLIVFSSTFALINRKSVKSGIISIAACGAVSLLAPDYSVLLAIIMVPLFVYLLIKKDTTALFLEGGAVVVLILMGLLGNGLCTPESFGRVERSMLLYIHQRVSWPFLQELRDCYINLGVNNDSGINDAVNMYERFFEDYSMTPVRKLGYSAMVPVYRQLITEMWAKRSAYFARELVKDIIFNFFAPFSVVAVAVRDISDTLIPMVISNFMMAAPGISGLLLYGFEGSCVGIMVFGLLSFHKGDKIKWGLGLVVICIMLVISVYYSVFWFRGFDYRNTLFSTAFPIVLIVGNILKKRNS